MATDGSWLLVRSDRLVISIATPGVPYMLGRSRQLPAAQQLSSKYVSSEHLCFILSADKQRLNIYQLGKNPTFCGSHCVRLHTVADSSPTTTPSMQVSLTNEANAHAEPAAPTSPNAPVTVTVSPCAAGVASAPPSRAETAGATLYFPDELALPSFAVRFEGGAAHHLSHGTAGDASTAKLSVPQMLSVPAPSTLLDDEDNDSDTAQRALGGGAGGPKPGWQGLLDVALQQQQQRQDKESAQPPLPQSEPLPTATVEAPTATTLKRPRSPPTSTPTEHPPVTDTPPKAGRKDKPATPASSSAHAPAAPSAKMGFWEWKCHADGADKNPKSWRKYPLAVAQMLEKAYRAKQNLVDIPDHLLFSDSTLDTSKCTYGVCLKEASVRGAMIQYQKDDPSRFRSVRRTGGDDVDRHGVKAAHIVPSSSSSESESSFSSDDTSISTDTDSDD